MEVLKALDYSSLVFILSQATFLHSSVIFLNWSNVIGGPCYTQSQPWTPGSRGGCVYHFPQARRRRLHMISSAHTAVLVRFAMTVMSGVPLPKSVVVEAVGPLPCAGTRCIKIAYSSMSPDVLSTALAGEGSVPGELACRAGVMGWSPSRYR